MPMELHCLYAGLCSGCDRLHSTQAELLEERLSILKRFGLPPDVAAQIQVEWIGSGGLRDRVELVVERTRSGLRSGLYENAWTHKARLQKTLVHLAGCSQFSHRLEEFHQEFIADLPPVAHRGSARLRVGPRNDKGVWLDYSNNDIRDILDEGNVLSSWLSRAFTRGWIVEMGQRRKRVVETDPSDSTRGRRFRLVDPVLAPWFQTWVGEKPYDLYSTIGTFTQPGLEANRRLVRTVAELAELTATGRGGKIHRAIEFGCGIGNFTLPLLKTAEYVEVFESDRLALYGLERSLDRVDWFDRKTLKINSGDFIQTSKEIDIGSTDLILVDPPRSGLGRFLDILERPEARAADWIYVSCYPESFGKDLAVFTRHGFKVERMHIVEQFPYTRHFEIVAFLRQSHISANERTRRGDGLPRQSNPV